MNQDACETLITWAMCRTIFVGWWCITRFVPDLTVPDIIIFRPHRMPISNEAAPDPRALPLYLAKTCVSYFSFVEVTSGTKKMFYSLYTVSIFTNNHPILLIYHYCQHRNWGCWKCRVSLATTRALFQASEVSVKLQTFSFWCASSSITILSWSNPSKSLVISSSSLL